jgi:hypothetical protein
VRRRAVTPTKGERMSEDTERRRAVWQLWLARGLGYGALGLVLLGFMVLHEGSGFFWVGVVLGLIALVIGAPAGWRLKKLREQEEESAGDIGRTAAGFTLGCGLLVGTLVLLMWLFPSHIWPFAHQGQGGRKVACLSNVKNLALALQMYLADNDDAFPRADSWCESLEDYIKNWDVLQCPSVRDRGGERECDYAFNDALGGANVSDLADPATAVAIFESDVGWNAAGDASILPAAPRHFEGDNYGCADGHATWVTRDELSLGQAEIGWSVEGAK